MVRRGGGTGWGAGAGEVGAGRRGQDVLREEGVAVPDGGLVLRRVLGADGRSKAFVNDQPVSVQLLKEAGESLVEIHGQFESQRLLKEAHHRELLDAYGGLGGDLDKVRGVHAAWMETTRARREAEAEMEAAAMRDYIATG